MTHLMPVPGRQRLLAGRPTIAFFASTLGPDIYLQKWQIWSGVERVCREHNANLLYVAGGVVGLSREALLYELISPQGVDGIISWTGTVFPTTGQAQAAAFLNQYAPLPVVNVGWPLPGIPSVIFDQACGVEDLLEHLVDVHGLRRIAYAFFNSTYNVTKASSFSGYEATLRRYGLYNPELVFDWTDTASEGKPSSDQLLKLLRCQAAVCPTDSDAVALIRLLEENHIRVPDDFAVTGIHGSQEARVAIPPLTTARIPFYKGGKQAAELLFQRMSGETIPEYSMMPLELIVRESCGCLDSQIILASRPGLGREKKKTNLFASGCGGKRTYPQ